MILFKNIGCQIQDGCQFSCLNLLDNRDQGLRCGWRVDSVHGCGCGGDGGLNGWDTVFEGFTKYVFTVKVLAEPQYLLRER